MKATQEFPATSAALPRARRQAKVLVVTSSVGAGHNAAARAIVAAMGLYAPEIGVESVDVLAHTPRSFRIFYAGGYTLAVTRFPALYGVGYRLKNRPQDQRRRVSERKRLWFERRAMRRFADYVLEAQPDLLVHTHFLAGPMIERMRRHGQLTTPQFVVVTDNALHRYWYCENVDRWFVPADFSAQPLRMWGIAPDTITVSGIPVHPKWTQPLERAKVLSDWNLPGDKRIVLLSGGTEFTCGPVTKLACQIVDSSPEAHVIVLAGRNKKLLAELAKLSESRDRLVGLSFTDRAHELVRVCSLMVTKAGGMTTTECLAGGAAMVLLRPLPGQEGGNAAYLAREGAAVVVRRWNEVASTVCHLLDDAAALGELTANAIRLYRPGAETIINEIRQAVNCPRPG